MHIKTRISLFASFSLYLNQTFKTDYIKMQNKVIGGSVQGNKLVKTIIGDLSITPFWWISRNFTYKINAICLIFYFPQTSLKPPT